MTKIAVGKLSFFAAASAVVLLLSYSASLQAADQTWTGGSTTDGNWSDADNWLGGAPPGDTSVTTNTDIATFNAPVGANNWGNSAGNSVVIDSGSQNIGGINFDTGTDNYFIGNGGNSLLLTSGGAIQILSTLTSTNATETINAPLVIEGSSGTYTFANNSANGTGAGAGTLDIMGNISGGASGSTVLTLSGSNTNANTISGSISEGLATTMGVTVSGTGTWVLTNSSSYIGATTLNGGTLAITSDAAINNGSGGIVFGGGTLQFNNYASGSLPSASFNNVANLSLGAATGTASSLSTSIAGSTALTFVGPGTLQLLSANSYNGGTTVTAGTLQGDTNSLQGNITNSGTVAFNLSGDGTYNGVLSGAGTVTKFNTGNLMIASAQQYTGATNLTGGPMTVTASGSIGSMASPAGTITVGVAGSAGGNTAGGVVAGVSGGNSTLFTVSGGSINATSLNVNNEGASSGFLLSSGSVTLTGNLGACFDGVNQPGLITLSSGILSANSATTSRSNVSITSVQTAGNAARGLYVHGATVNIATTVGLDTDTTSSRNASTSFMTVDAGSMTVGGAITITCNNSGRYSVFDVTGTGALTDTDTTTGIQIGGNYAASEGELLIRNTGVVTTNKITMGNATQVTSGADVLELAGGTLYVGSGGIVNGGTAGTTTNPINFGVNTSNSTTAPILGAAANWSTSLVMTLANNASAPSGNQTPIVQAADSMGTAHNITLGGRLSGAGGLTKTGGGTLTLSASNFNTYTGITTISGGVISTGTTGTLANGGSSSSVGQSTNVATNLILDNGTLQYASTSGTPASTDRLFTVTQNGGGLDASGTSAVTFAGNGVGAANAIAYSGSGARTLTLTGSNIGANTVAPIIGDGTGGSTSLKKTGIGSWIVSNSNTYSGNLEVDAGNLTLSGSNAYVGTTLINGGKLIVSSTGSLTGNTAITVNSTGTFAPNPGSLTNTIGSSGASLTLNAGSSFSMQDTGIGIVNLNSVGGGASTVFTLGGTNASPTNLSFDVGNSGAGADELVANNGTVSFTGTVNDISLAGLGGTAPSTLTNIPLISVPNGTLVLSDFTINPSQLPLVFGASAYAPSLTLDAGSHSLLLNLTATSLSFYWKGGSGTSWGSANNFATDHTGATLRPSAPTLGSNVFLTADSAASFSQTLDASYNINSLSFTGSGTSAATNSITLASGGGGTNTLTLGAVAGFQDAASNNYAAGTGLVVQSGSAAHTISANVILGATQTWEIDNSAANALTVSGVVDDSGSNFGLTKTGTGSLKLSNVNTYGGLTTVSAGTVTAANDSALGSSTAVTAGLLLNPSSGTATVNFTSASPAIASLASSGAGTSNVVLGNSSLGSATTLTVGGNNVSSVYAGTISDGTSTNINAVGSLTKTGTGTTTLGGSGTYTGATTLNSGALAITSDAAINNGAGGINFNGGALQFNSYASSALPASIFDNNPNLKLGAGTGAAASLSTTIADSSVLTYVGPGTLQLTGNNTYSGGTNINGGELNAGSVENPGTSGPFGSSGIISFGGGALQYSAVNQYDYSGRIFNSTGAIALDTNGLDVTINGSFDASNTGGLTKLGAGSLTLTNVNNYIGLTTVSAGSLNVQNDGALASSTAVTSGLLLNPSSSVTATVNFTTAVPAIGSLASAAGASGTGTSQVVLGNATAGAATTLTMGGSNNSTNFSGSISDGTGTNAAAIGNIVKLGVGTQTLSGANTYTGTTMINGGPLTVNGTGSIGSMVTPAGNMTVGVAGGAGGNTIGGNAVAGGSSARLNVSGAVTTTNLALNNEGGTNLSVTGGTLTVTGNLGVNDDGNNNGGLASLTGGIVTANSVTVHRSSITSANATGTTPLFTGSSGTGLLVNGATLNIATTLALDTGNNSASASSANMQVASGNVTVGGTTTITISNGTARWSILDVAGGTFTSNDTAGAGIQIGGGVSNSSSNGELLVRGGTLTTNKITFGDSVQTGGRDNLELIGGTTYVGSGGIVNASSTGPTITANLGETTLATTPILGAKADWSSSVPITLFNNNASVAPTIQAADSLNNPHNITLSGVVTDGGGVTLIKTGGGKLALTGADTLTGITVQAGSLGTGLVNQNLGTLTLPNSATTHLDMGIGGRGEQIQFSANGGELGTSSVLQVDDWTPGADHLDFNTLNADQLSLINFTGYGSGAKFVSGSSGEIVPVAAVSTTFLPGDVNDDHHLDAADLLAEEKALANLAQYQSAAGNAYGIALTTDELYAVLDQNGDGLINGADVQYLISALQMGKGSILNVPEPSSLILLGLALPAIWAARRRRYNTSRR